MNYKTSLLEQWEAKLAPLLRAGRIRWLTETPLTVPEVEQIEAEIRLLIQRYSLRSSTERLGRTCPATFAVYLAYKAAHNPSRSLWQYLARTFNVKESDLQNARWGATFLRILKRFGLPTVEEGHKYVQTMRLHGGIPAYSLPDFFEHVVLLSLEHPEYSGLPLEEALKRIKQRWEYKYAIDQPVRLWLEEGQGARWFAQLREAVQKIWQGEPVDPAPLPPYVWDALYQYLTRRGELRAQQEARRGWRPPRLLYRGDDVFLVYLPEQRLRQRPATLYQWVIEVGETALTRRMRVRRRGAEAWIAEAEEALSSLPAGKGEFTVTLQALMEQGGEWMSVRRWRLRGIAHQLPLMAFRYEDGQALLPATVLPSTVSWLLVPEGHRIHIVPEARKRVVEEPFVFPEGWHGAAYDLHEASAVEVYDAQGNLLGRLPVEEYRQPRLEGKALTPAPDGAPWFIGQAPILWLPVRPLAKGQTPESVLAQWRIRLQSDEQAHPEGLWQNRDFAGEQVVEQDNGLWLRVLLNPPLSRSVQLIAGRFRLECSGPGLPYWSTSFFVWPHIEIRHLKPCYSPTAQEGPPEIALWFSLQGRIKAAGEGVAVRPKGKGLFEVRVAPENSAALLHLELPEASLAALPLRLPLPRPQWRVVTWPEAETWSVRPVPISLDRLLAHLDKPSQPPVLALNLPCTEVRSLHLRLVDLENQDGEEALRRIEGEELSRQGSVVLLDLRRLSDDLRKAKENPRVLFLGLEAIWQTEGEEHRALLLRLTQGIHLKVPPWLEYRPDGVWLHWYEPSPLRHRRAFLWSRWQPWMRPLVLALPDQAQPGESAGWWMTLLEQEGIPISLPPGKYDLLFTTALPWERIAPPREPPTEHPALVSVQTVSPEEHLHRLKQRREKAKPGQAFRLTFEQAAIADDLGDTKQRAEALKWLNSHWRDASPKLLLALHRWLEPRDALSAKSIRYYLYRLPILKKAQTITLGVTPQEARAFLGDYFTPLLNNPNVPLKPEAAALFLELSDDPAVVSIALHRLLTAQGDRWEERALAFLLQAIAGLTLTPEDAADFLLLEKVPEQQREGWLGYLLQTPPTSARQALLHALAQRDAFPQYLVRPGYWVCSDAGWGRIERIRVQGEETDLWVREPNRDAAVVLEVRLRAGDEAGTDNQKEEWAWLDWGQRRIQLRAQPDDEPLKQAWVCTKCRRFLSRSVDIVREEHTRAAHRGLSPAFAPVTLPARWRPEQAYFSAHPPQDVFACEEETQP